jgi:hypothetical protein
VYVSAGWTGLVDSSTQVHPTRRVERPALIHSAKLIITSYSSLISSEKTIRHLLRTSSLSGWRRSSSKPMTSSFSFSAPWYASGHHNSFGSVYSTYRAFFLSFRCLPCPNHLYPLMILLGIIFYLRHRPPLLQPFGRPRLHRPRPVVSSMCFPLLALLCPGGWCR